MKFSDHALLRFVQRVLKIEDENEAWQYIQENKYEIYYRLLKLINESEVLIKNFVITGDGQSYNYLIHNDILIVITSDKNVVVTLYDVKIDLNTQINSKLIQNYMKTIRRNNIKVSEKDVERKENDRTSRGLEALIKNKELELEQLKTELEINIEVSKNTAAETKKIRHQNRAIMEKIMFGYKKFS